MVHSGRYLFSSACAFRVTLVAKLLKQECLQTLQKYLPFLQTYKILQNPAKFYKAGISAVFLVHPCLPYTFGFRAFGFSHVRKR